MVSLKVINLFLIMMKHPIDGVLHPHFLQNDDYVIVLIALPLLFEYITSLIEKPCFLIQQVSVPILSFAHLSIQFLLSLALYH